MRKRNRTAIEKELDNKQQRGFMAFHKPKQSATEWFKRPPYQITRGEDIGESKTNEQQEV